MLPSTRIRFYQIYNFAGDFIYTNNENTLNHQKVCDKQVVDLLMDSIKIVLLIILSLFFMYCVPLYNILIKNEYDVIIPNILPFVDPQTKTGFLANLANQLIFCFYGVIALTGIELITCVMKSGILATAAVIKNEFCELDEILQQNEKFSSNFTWQFRNILVKILDFDRLTADFTNLYYWKFLVQPGFMVYTVSMSIFLFLKVCIHLILFSLDCRLKIFHSIGWLGCWTRICCLLLYSAFHSL